MRLMDETDTWNEPADKTPLGLSHVDSNSCWCDPVVEVDGGGREVVVHREIIWN